MILDRFQAVYYGWWVVISSAVVLLVGLGLGLYTFPVFYPALIDAFGWSRGEVVTGGALLMVVLAAMSPFIGMMLDRYGARTILATGVVTVGLALLSFIFVASLWQFYAACVLLGFGLCGVSHMPNQVLISNWFAQKRGLAVGLISAGVGLGGAVGPIMVTYLIDHHGWRAGFAGMGAAVLALPLLLVLLVVKRRPQDIGLQPDGATAPPHPGSGRKSDGPLLPGDWTFQQAVRSTSFWVLFLAIFFISAMMYAVSQHLVVYLRDKGFTSQQAAGALSLLLGMSAVGKLVFGSLSDRFNRRNVMLLSFLLLTGSSLYLLAAPRLSLVYCFAIAFGLGYGGVFSCMPVVTAQYFGLRALGKILGSLFLSFNLGGSLWPIATGYLFDWLGNYDLIFMLNPILGLAAAGAVLLLPRTREALINPAIEYSQSA